MADFYEVLARHYDEIFPPKGQQLHFFKKVFSDLRVKSVLDVGCGTGAYVLEFSDWGIEASGVDLSLSMIEIARGKASSAGKQIGFELIDMLELYKMPGAFDCILCMGNTLAHLRDKDELTSVLSQFKEKAKYLLVQVVNYDRILEQRVTQLPEIKTPNLVFHRYYEYLPDRISFSMELKLSSGEKLRASNNLRPLLRSELERAMHDQGWKPLNWWGNFAAEAWSPLSQASIVLAQAI